MVDVRPAGAPTLVAYEGIAVSCRVCFRLVPTLPPQTAVPAAGAGSGTSKKRKSAPSGLPATDDAAAGVSDLDDDDGVAASGAEAEPGVDASSAAEKRPSHKRARVLDEEDE